MLGTCFLGDVALLIETICFFATVVLPDLNIEPIIRIKQSVFIFFMRIYSETHVGLRVLRGPFLLAQWVKEEFQTVDLDLVDGLQHATKFAGGETLLGKPDHIRFR